MNRKRLTNPLSKQSPISSISSRVPLMTTGKNDDNDIHFSTPSLPNHNTTVHVHSFSQPLPMSSNSDSKRSLTISQPKGTITYTVGNGDTLEKAALRFNSTPSELRQLNKLNTRIIFPGQILFVPEDSSSNTSNQPQSTIGLAPSTSPSSLTKPKDGDAFILLADRRLSTDLSFSPNPPQEQQQDVGPMVWSMARKPAARPGRAQRLNSEPSIESEPSPGIIEDHFKTLKEDNSEQVQMVESTSPIKETHQIDDECIQRFIKVNVRLMTEDHKGVAGTLLVTPNAVMFDPDVLDPLVKEHGIDKYGLIIRMNLLAGIALYEDIIMYEHKATSRDEEKRKMCHSTSVKNVQHCPTTPLNTDEEQIHGVMSSLLDKIDKELNPSTSSDTCCVLFNAATTLQRHLSINSTDKHFDNNSFLPTPTDDILSDDSLQYSNDLFQPFDDYKHSIGILLDNDDNDNINKDFNRIPSQGCHLENGIPLDPVNERFEQIDKLLQKHQKYFEPHPIEVPYYLCVKTSINIHDIPSLYARRYKKIGEQTMDNAYGKKQLEHEYWFSVPKEKTDSLYSFFLRWTPERHVDPLIDNEDQSSNMNPPSSDQSKVNDKSSGKGFILLPNNDPELPDDYLLSSNNPKNQQTDTEQLKKSHYLTRQNTLLKEWEIISIDEIYRRINSAPTDDRDGYDVGIPPPKLLQPSTLVSEEQSKQILIELPARVQGLNWHMTFSTETNGFSLNQLYRRSLEVDHDLPSLLIVKDIEQHMFGAFVSRQLMVSEGFYGTGESFLFTFYPEFRVFNWSGHNEFFVKGDLHALGFGSGEGTYGLWLDADLYHGRTCPSKTFNNVRLSSNEDFIVASIEVWTFID